MLWLVVTPLLLMFAGALWLWLLASLFKLVVGASDDKNLAIAGFFLRGVGWAAIG
jgi:hypothetical protein